MRAVWSFWSRPHSLFYHGFWHSERAHLLCWVLSVTRAAAHFPQTCLVTDTAGARLLVDELGLPFTTVSDELERLNRTGADPQWWVLGKLAAYAAQSEPFLHLDADVILWKPLPSHLASAPVVAQNPEHFDLEDQTLYRADQFIRTIAECGGWLPDEWHSYAVRRRTAALCCGILGGTDVDFLGHYARRATEIIMHPRNASAWERIGIRDNILVEQYFLAACLDAEASRGGRGMADRVGYLFPSSSHAFDPLAAEEAGYTHLIGDAKADPGIAERLEQRIRAEHPVLHERCMRLCDDRRSISAWG